MSTAATPRPPDSALPARDALLAALADAADRFQALVRSATNEQATTPIAGSTWSVADSAAHVLTVVRRTFQDRRRSQSAADLAELNALCLAELSERRLPVLADQLVADVPRMLAVLAGLAPDRPIPFHAGIQTTLRPVLAVLLGEFLVHGYDVATALGRPWPIAAAEADLLCRGVAPLLGAWLAPAAGRARLAYALELGADAPPLVLAVVDGQLSRAAPPGQPLQTLVADPVELALGVIYKRRAVTDPRLAPLAELFLSP